MKNNDKEKTKSKKVLAVYVILRVFVILVMIPQFIHGNYANVFLCLLTLVLFFIPSFVNKKLNIALPGPLEIIILLFIVASEILGEVGEYYINIPHWDTMLHTVNGFLVGAIGFSMIDILNQNEKFHFKTTPLFVAVVAVCFSMTIGVLWEFFEFSMDVFLNTDMQKDTILNVISSVNINPDGVNKPIKVIVDSEVLNGGEYVFNGYLDIGLYDTMKDLIVNFIGAIAFSVVGGIYITGRGTWAKKFIPTMKQ